MMPLRSRLATLAVWGLALAAGVGGGAPAAPARSLELPCAWRPGDAFSWQGERRRTQARQGQTSEGRSTYAVRLEVRERDADGYLLGWRQDLGSVLVDGVDRSAEAEALAGGAGDLSLLIRADARLAPVALLNGDEVRAALGRALERAVPPEAGPEAREAVGRMMGAPGVVDGLVLTEPRLLLSTVCAEVEAGRPLERAAQLPNPFGGPPLPGRANLALEGVDEAAGVARLRFGQTVDAGAVRALLEDMARRMGQAPPAGAVPPVSVEDRGTAAMSLRDGLPARLEWQRTVSILADSQVDRRSYARLPR